MRCALLAAALAQVFPALSVAANDAAKEAAKKEAAPTACEDCPDDSGKSGWLEVGIGSLSDTNYHSGRFSGLEDDGAWLDASGEYRYRGQGNGAYLDVAAENLGLESRSVRLDGGRQGKYGIQVEYSQIPDFREADTRSPFISRDGGRLDLPAGWVAGPTTAPTDMPTLASDLQRTPLKTERDRLGVKFSLVPAKDWEVSGHFRREEKDGTKDVGATVSFNQTVILPVAVNYQTDDFGLAAGYSGERFQARLAYQGSLFKNGAAQVAWENPFAAFPGSASGQMADAPDNQMHQISTVLGYQLTESTRLMARLSRGRLSQDEALLPYTVGGAAPGGNMDGRIDTTLAKVEINSRPTPKLRLDASYTYSDRDNKTPVGTYDYVVTDVSSGGLRQNTPFGFEQKLLRAKLGYRLPKDIDLALGFDQDEISRTYQQVEETTDKTLWARLKARPWDPVEATLKLSRADRDASAYVPLPGEHSLMRVHYLADRERNKAGLDLTVTPTDTLSLGFDAEYVKDDYRDMYLGLNQADGVNANVNVTYAFSQRLTGSAFYNYERLSSDQSGASWSTVPVLEEPWLASDRNVTETVGVNLNWVAIPDKLDIGVDLVHAEYQGDLDYEGGIDLPRLKAKLTGLGVHGVYKLKDNLSMRVGYRYERYKESDWSKSAVVNAIPTLLTMGAAPANEETHLFMVSLRYAFN